MQISVSSALTVFYDGQFWVGLAERVGDGRYGAARIVFGAEPSDEEILQFVRSKWAKLAFFDDETGVGPRKKPTPRGRDGGALRATEAEAQAEAPRALIVICGKPYVEAVSVPLETDTAIYCVARQQAISTLLVFDICISNSMQHPVSFVVNSLEGRSRGSSSDSFHEGTNACWLQ